MKITENDHSVGVVFPTTTGAIESLKKCLRDIVYMAESGLHTKNELAFARLIAEAKELCKE